MAVPANCRYSKTHEWAKKEGDSFVIGITDFAQHELGDIVFVELPPAGSKFKKGDTFGVIESVKAASDLYLPMTGEIVETNEALASDPALVNKDPHGAAWLLRLKASSAADFEAMMDSAAYEKFIASDEAKH